MAVMMLAAGMGMLSMMSNNQADKDADAKAENDAKAYGIKVAGLDFSARAQADVIIGEVGRLQTVEALGVMEIDKAQAKAESDAKVSAGAAGVSGQSVDAVVNDTERTAAESKKSLSNQVTSERLQLSTNYTDTFLNAHMNKGILNTKTKSSGDRMLGGALAFAQGFMGGL